MDLQLKYTRKNQKRKNKISKKNKDIMPIRCLKQYSKDFERLKTQMEEGKINDIAFEELSTQLLIKIDAVETDGIEKIRNLRKQLVVYINKNLEKN